jgi:hypothetical protein
MNSPDAFMAYGCAFVLFSGPVLFGAVIIYTKFNIARRAITIREPTGELYEELQERDSREG